MLALRLCCDMRVNAEKADPPPMLTRGLITPLGDGAGGGAGGGADPGASDGGAGLGGDAVPAHTANGDTALLAASVVPPLLDRPFDRPFDRPPPAPSVDCGPGPAPLPPALRCLRHACVHRLRTTCFTNGRER